MPVPGFTGLIVTFPPPEPTFVRKGEFDGEGVCASVVEDVVVESADAEEVDEERKTIVRCIDFDA